MAGDDITVHVEWLARRLAQQQEDAAATERQQEEEDRMMARRLAQQQQEEEEEDTAAAAEQRHRIMVKTLRVSRVPDHVRYSNADAYTPGLVAIGPLHAGNRRLRTGARLKKAYLHRLISRGQPDPAHHLAVIQGYVRLVAAREREARAMYADEVIDDISGEDLVQMLVLDGCFIIEHLVNVSTGVKEESLHATPFGPLQLSVDLVLAENQIPFFVLVDLIGATALPELDNSTTAGHQPTKLLMKLALYYLAGDKGRDMSGELLAPGGVFHVLHLLHAMVTAARKRWERELRQRLLQSTAALEMSFQEAARLLQRLPLQLLVPLLYPIVPEESRWWHASYGRDGLPSATDLKRMWVRLMNARGGGGGGGELPAGIASVLGPVPLAVKLEHEDWLHLPQLRIEFRTAPLLLNLMAFEQSAYQPAGDVSAYVWLMEKLVQTPEDAVALMAAEVLQSSGSVSKEDVVRFFKRVAMASEAAAELEKSYLGETLGKLRERSQQPIFMVKSYYLNTPWRLVAAFVTVVTTVTSILQTYAAFKQK